MSATPTVFASGTQSGTIGSEFALASPTGAGIFIFCVDLTNLAAGDALELRLKKKVLTGGAVGVVWKGAFYNAQDSDSVIAISLPLTVAFGCTASLKQVAGTARSYDWELLQL